MKADRLISLLLMLQSAQRRTARELAESLEVSERTIYRDVDALSSSGVPVYAERGSSGGIRLSEGYKRALTHLGEDDVRALFASGSAVLADLGLGTNFERALDKLRGAFSEPQRRIAEKARGRIHIDQRRWNATDPPTEKLALLRRAVWDDRRVELRYEDRNGAPTTRTIDPYGLVSKAGVWYLVSHTGEPGLRSFRVDRIVDVRELDAHFERPDDFDLDAYWRASSAALNERYGAGFVVTLRLGPGAAELVGTYWPSERVDAEEPSIVRMSFFSEDVAVTHVLAWGTAVELLEPQRLRVAIAERARDLVIRYGPGP